MQKFTTLCFSLVIIIFAACKSEGSATDYRLKYELSKEDREALIQKEITHWQLAKLKNLGTLQNDLSSRYIGYFGTHVLNAASTANAFADVTINDYRLSNIKVLPVDDDVAIVYYILNRDIVDKNAVAWSPKVAASATYAKEGEVWKTIFYQETRMAD